jgi:hypothetical protein
LSDDERRQLKAAAYGDFIRISAASLQKFLEFKLVKVDSGKVVITLDGKRAAQWSLPVCVILNC